MTDPRHPSLPSLTEPLEPLKPDGHTMTDHELEEVITAINSAFNLGEPSAMAKAAYPIIERQVRAKMAAEIKERLQRVMDTSDEILLRLKKMKEGLQ